MRSRGWLGKVMVGSGATLLAAGTLLILISLFQESSYRSIESISSQDTLAHAVVQQPAVQPDKVLYGMVVNNLEVIEGQVKRNQRFTDLFKPHFVNDKVVRQLSALSRDVFDF